MKTIIIIFSLIISARMSNLCSQEVKISEIPVNKPNHIGLMMETTVDNKNIRLPMAIFLPKSYQESENRKFPAILFLHGAGEGGGNLQAIFIHGPSADLCRDTAMLENFPFIVFSPQISSSWSWDSYALKVTGVMLKEVCKRYRVDIDNIMVTGLSMGGLGSWEALNELPDIFSSASPMCARAWRDPYTLATKLTHHSIWTMVGGVDGIAFLGGTKTMFNALRTFGVDTQMTIVPNVDHFVWMLYYKNPEYYHWAIHQRKPTVTMVKQADQFLALQNDKNGFSNNAIMKSIRKDNQGLTLGWKAEWFKDTELKTSLIKRTEAKIDYPDGQFNLPDNIRENISARYTGFIKISKPGFYQFYTAADDGTRLFVNKQRIMDDWNVHGIVLQSGAAYLGVGYHEIEVQYFQGIGGAGLSVYWSFSGSEKKLLTEVESEPLDK